MDCLVEDTDILNGLNDGTLGYDDLPQMREVADWYKKHGAEGLSGRDLPDR